MNTMCNLLLSFLLLQGSASSDSGGQVNINWFKMLGQFFFLILLFALILFAAYYVTKLIANVQYQKFQSSNIKIIETVGISPQKSLQLVKVGNKIYLLAITKDNIIFISEIDENQIILSDNNHKQSDLKFDYILKNLIGKVKKPSQEKDSNFDGEILDEEK